MSSITIETHDHQGKQYRHPDARGLKFSTHYSPKGSGYGYCKFTIPRPIGRDWSEVGYYYELKLMSGPFECLHHGEIRQIVEAVGSGGEELQITSVGFSALTEDELYNTVYADSRYQSWASSEEIDGFFRPDRFDYSVSRGVEIRARDATSYTQNDYLYVRYPMLFGKTISRFSAKFRTQWWTRPMTAMLVDADAELILWSTLNGNDKGEIDVEVAQSGNLDLRLYLIVSGTVYATSTDPAYVLWSDVMVKSTNDLAITGKDIVDDLVGVLAVSGLGISDSVEHILDPSVTLEPAFFTDDKSVADILDWVAQFGHGDGRPLAWGVRFNDQKELFLEPWDVTKIAYYVQREQVSRASVSGDMSRSYQKVYGIYNDEFGVEQRTSDHEDADTIENQGGRWRRGAIKFSGLTDPDVIDHALALWLAENSGPKVTSSFTVQGGLYGENWQRMPLELVRAGGMVQIQDFRAREAEAQVDDFRDQHTTFMVVATEMDVDRQALKLTPAGAQDEFAQYMARLAKLK